MVWLCTSRTRGLPLNAAVGHEMLRFINALMKPPADIAKTQPFKKTLSNSPTRVALWD